MPTRRPPAPAAPFEDEERVVDARTKLLIGKDSRRLVSPATDALVDVVVDTLEIDDETRVLFDPTTGRSIDPETGFPVEHGDEWCVDPDGYVYPLASIDPDVTLENVSVLAIDVDGVVNAMVLGPKGWQGLKILPNPTGGEDIETAEQLIHAIDLLAAKFTHPMVCSSHGTSEALVKAGSKTDWQQPMAGITSPDTQQTPSRYLKIGKGWIAIEAGEHLDNKLETFVKKMLETNAAIGMILDDQLNHPQAPDRYDSTHRVCGVLARLGRHILIVSPAIFTGITREEWAKAMNWMASTTDELARNPDVLRHPSPTRVGFVGPETPDVRHSARQHAGEPDLAKIRQAAETADTENRERMFRNSRRRARARARRAAETQNEVVGQNPVEDTQSPDQQIAEPNTEGEPGFDIEVPTSPPSTPSDGLSRPTKNGQGVGL